MSVSVPSILQCSSTAVHLVAGEGTPERSRHQPCFASWDESHWCFENNDKVQFHTDALNECANTYFTDCLKTTVMRQGGWSGTPPDLVYEQLRELLSGCDDVLFVPSAVYSDEQLGVLGGVLQAVAKPVAIMKTALAYGRALPQGRYIVIEMEIHDAVLTGLDVTADSATIRPAKVLHGIGLQYFYNEQFRIICERFVQRHRYDVGHVAGNKSLLLKQLQDQWSHDKDTVCLSLNDMEAHIEKQSLAVCLPDRLSEQTEGFDRCLVPSHVIPGEHIFYRETLLPPLRDDCLRALARDIATEQSGNMKNAVPPEKINVFHTIGLS